MELPHRDRLHWILRASALLIDGGAEPVSGLVLPNGTYFPDPFDGSLAAVDRLLRRVLLHAGLSEVAVELAVTMPDGSVAGGGCSSGGCAKPLPAASGARRVARSEGGYVVTVGAGEIGHPTLVTTVLARAAAELFLHESELLSEIEPREGEAHVDLCGVMLGFGVLLANGSHIVSKGCGGLSVAQATVLPLEELAVALAVFCSLHGIRARTARAELDPTPREAFDEAAVWADANARAVRLVREDRAAVEAGSYQLSEARGWLSRLFRRKSREGAPTDDELERLGAGLRQRSAGDREKAERIARLRALVDEQLDG